MIKIIFLKTALEDGVIFQGSQEVRDALSSITSMNLDGFNLICSSKDEIFFIDKKSIDLKISRLFKTNEKFKELLSENNLEWADFADIYENDLSIILMKAVDVEGTNYFHESGEIIYDKYIALKKEM